MEPESNSQPKDNTHSTPQTRRAPAKRSWKKRCLIFVIAAGASAFGTLAYLNKSADPTTWESMRTNYKNTK